MKYKKEFIDFFRQLCDHKENEIRLNAAYNLPCFNIIFKDQQKELDINFFDLYDKFVGDESQEIADCTVKSLHEAFKLVEPEDNTAKIRKIFLDFVVDEQKDILLIINKNLDVFIQNYGNKHTIENFKGRTVYKDSQSDDGGNKFS